MLSRPKKELPDMKYYLAIFLRRLPIFVLVSSIITVVAFFIAASLPAVYTSQARFLLEGSQIPGALAPPTVNTPPREQVQLLEQRMMSRANLLDIARRLDVFPDQARMRPDEIVVAMREATTISPNLTRDGASILTVSFRASSGQKAAGVVGEYVSLIQQQDVENRTGRAGQTLEFFRQEVSRLEGEMAGISAQLVAFRTENADALPEGSNFRLGRQGMLQERISQADREISTLTTQRARLIEIYNATGRIEGLSGVQLTPQQQELQDLRRQRDEALAVYAPGNPRIRVLDTRIAQLETLVANQTASSASDMSPLDMQLAEIDSRIDALNAQKAESTTELEAVNDLIRRSAANGVQLASLEREYANLQVQYNSAVNNMAQASTGERIEVLSRGNRVTLLEQPVAPTTPSSPNRLLIGGAGMFLGIAAGVGLIILIEILKTAPRRPEAIVKKLGITPLATLPLIQSRGDKLRQRRMSFALVVAILIAVPASVWAVHTFYRPIDLLAERVAEKIGVRW